MRRPEKPLPDKTRVFIHDRPLGSTEKMNGISRQYLVARRPNAEGIAWGVVLTLNDDVYWVKHGNDRVMAVYGYWEFELVEDDEG